MKEEKKNKKILQSGSWDEWQKHWLGSSSKMLINSIVTLDKFLNIANFRFLLIYKIGPRSSSKILKST